jgi:hypothetical protein
MATKSIKEIMEKIQESVTNKVGAKMAEDAGLFAVSKMEKYLTETGDYQRNSEGKLVKKDGTVIDFEQGLNVAFPDAADAADNVKALNCFNEITDNLDECATPKSTKEYALRNALILQKLGFKVLEKNTWLGRLKIIESVENWMARTKREEKDTLTGTTTTGADNGNIRKDTIGSAAVTTLKAMVESVNYNPSILNPGFVMPKMKGEDYKARLPPTVTASTRPPLNLAWASMESMKGGANIQGEIEAINNVIKTNAFAIKLGSGLAGEQLGGGVGEYKLGLSHFDDNSFYAIRNSYHNLLDKLKAKNKDIAKDDKNLIEKQLESYESAHKKLLYSVELVKAMNEMVSKGLITKNEIPLQDVLDKQHHLVKKVDDRKKRLTVILSTLGGVLALETGSSKPQMEVPVVGAELETSLADMVIE